MHHGRSGTSLCEVLFALVLIALSASWALQAAGAAERAVGVAHGRTAAEYRAEHALRALHAFPCDSAPVASVITEPRWRLTLARTSQGDQRLDRVVLQSRRGDTITIARHRWCSR